MKEATETSLEIQWASYEAGNPFPKNSTGSRPAVAGGLLAAAGAAVFSLPSHANATIIYSGPLSQTVSWNNVSGSHIGSTFVKTGGRSFLARGVYLGPHHVGSAHLAAEGSKAGVATNGTGGLKKLAKGSAISSHRAFVVSNYGGLKRINRGLATFGTWASGKPYYAGIEIISGTAGPGTHYGWIELEYTTTGSTGSNSPYPGSIEVLGDAFETTPGQSIAAGDTGVSGVPEAGNTATALLLLACAGASLTSWRKRKRCSRPL